MPVIQTQVELFWKINAVKFESDGSVTVEMVQGYSEGGAFRQTESRAFHIDMATASQVLDTAPTAGLTRRDDICLAVYNHLVSAGLITGTVQ